MALEELSETCGVSFQNRFGKLVHLVGSIIRKLHRRGIFERTMMTQPAMKLSSSYKSGWLMSWWQESVRWSYR